MLYLLYVYPPNMYIYVHIPYNLAKRIIVFVSNPDKIIIGLDEVTQFLKECQNPEYVITKVFFNAKLKDPASKSEIIKNVILFILILTINP